MLEAKVSIALCTYNGARFIRQQLDSILAQTHVNFEILAADDGSIDDTVLILKEYAAKDSRIRVLVNSSNVGFKRNFEEVISKCSGDFIAPSDQDDIWMPEKLSTMLEAIGDRPMVYCDAEFVDALGMSFGLRVSDRLKLCGIDDPLVLVTNNCVSGHAMLFRRALLDCALPFPESFEYHDWWLAAVAASSGGVAYCDMPLVKYRLHAKNLTDMLGLKPASESQGRLDGHKSRYLKLVGERLSALAAIQGPHQDLMLRLSKSWRARDSQWLSVGFAWLMIKHGRQLNKLIGSGEQGLCWRNVRYAAGLKFKRLLKPRAYA